MALKKFHRSLTDRRVAGLFGGLGESFSIDPAYLRLAFVLVAIFTGVVPALIGYLVGWLITPEGTAREGEAGPEDRV